MTITTAQPAGTVLAPRTTLPPSAEGVVALLATAAAGLDGTPPTRWEPTERRTLIDALDRTITALSTARGDLLIAERSSGTWRSAGDPTFEAWRARTSRTGPRAAGGVVRRAETAASIPPLREAVSTGAVTLEHVDVVARVAGTASAPVRAALATAEGQAELVGLAVRQDAGEFARTAARWAARLDAAGLERTHQAQRAARYLHLVETPSGTLLKGHLDRMAGHRLRLALEAVSPRPAADDDRSAEQRRADALDTLSERILALPDTSPGAAVRPHISFVMTADAWAGLRAARRTVPTREPVARDSADPCPAGLSAPGDDRAGSSTQDLATMRRADEGLSSPSAPAPGGTQTPGVDPATLEDGTPVPLSELARALCDCELTRIVLDAESLPVDLGRTQRTYSGAHRRAIIARDRHCAWPGCTAHARWCEIHHIVWWDRGDGRTSLDNGVLLCSFHHHDVHRRDLAITRVPAPAPDRFHRPMSLGVSPPKGAASPGASPPSTVAEVTYRFTDPAGRLVAPAVRRGAEGGQTGAMPMQGGAMPVQGGHGAGAPTTPQSARISPGTARATGPPKASRASANATSGSFQAGM